VINLRIRRGALCAALVIGALVASASVSFAAKRNAIIFVADGLRYGSVNREDAPTLMYIREQGVNFINSHSVFPTFTTANASVIATGHYLGDTGNFSNTMYLGFPIFGSNNFGNTPNSFTPFIENDQVLSDMDDHFDNHNYLGESSLLSLARAQGYSTAAIGKHGPVAIQDVTQVNAVNGRFTTPQTVLIDDVTGTSNGIPLSDEMKAALQRADLPITTPRRTQPSSIETQWALGTNFVQQQFFVNAATKAVLPLFKQRGKPFVLLYWSRDPDGTQHGHGDSNQKLVPGINGPTSRAAVRDADTNLKQLLDYINADPELANNTDIFITSDHGFATISRGLLDANGQLTKSYSAQFQYRDRDGELEVAPSRLPPGFLAIDLAHELKLPLFDPDSPLDSFGNQRYAAVDPSTSQPTAALRQHPAVGNGFIGGSGQRLSKPDCSVVVTAGGGSDLIYVLNQDVTIVRQIVEFLSKQDYVGGLFVDSRYGDVPGALPLSSIRLEGSSQTIRPTIVVSFKSFSTDPNNPLMTAVQIADTGGQEGQGMHGSLARDNTYNNMAAIGPSFKQKYVDQTPVSNADLVPTLAHVLGIDLPQRGKYGGRVLKEALIGGPQLVSSKKKVMISKTTSNKATVLVYQALGEQLYFDEACLIGPKGAHKDPASPCH
jgi:arylsulfatase A-like enzyme